VGEGTSKCQIYQILVGKEEKNVEKLRGGRPQWGTRLEKKKEKLASRPGTINARKKQGGEESNKKAASLKDSGPTHWFTGGKVDGAGKKRNEGKKSRTSW